MERNVELTFKGGRELRQRMLELGPRFAETAFGRMVLAGAMVIADTARSYCPREADTPFRRNPGTLQKSIAAWIVEKSSTHAMAAAGVPRRGPAYAIPVEYGHVIAIGGAVTRPGRRPTSGREAGFVQPRPFMRAAWDAKNLEALAAMERIAALSLLTAAPNAA